MAAGAKGCEIVVKGKLGARGAKKRTERVLAGYMKKCGDPVKLVDQGHAIAKTKWATIGVHVYIVHPETTFPDHVAVPELGDEDIKRIEEKLSQPQQAEKREEAPVEEKQEAPKKRTRKTTRKKSVKKEEVADGDSKSEGTQGNE